MESIRSASPCLAHRLAPILARWSAYRPNSTAATQGVCRIYGAYDMMEHWQADLAVNSVTAPDKTELLLGVKPFADHCYITEPRRGGRSPMAQHALFLLLGASRPGHRAAAIGCLCAGAAPGRISV